MMAIICSCFSLSFMHTLCYTYVCAASNSLAELHIRLNAIFTEKYYKSQVNKS